MVHKHVYVKLYHETMSCHKITFTKCQKNYVQLSKVVQFGRYCVKNLYKKTMFNCVKLSSNGTLGTSAPAIGTPRPGGSLPSGSAEGGGLGGAAVLAVLAAAGVQVHTGPGHGGFQETSNHWFL